MLQIRHSSLIAIHLTAVAMYNSSIILHAVDDILRQRKIKRENFSLFLTDAARYMSSAGKTLKQGWPTRGSRAARGSLPRFMWIF